MVAEPAHLLWLLRQIAEVASHPPQRQALHAAQSPLLQSWEIVRNCRMCLEELVGRRERIYLIRDAVPNLSTPAVSTLLPFARHAAYCRMPRSCCCCCCVVVVVVVVVHTTKSQQGHAVRYCTDRQTNTDRQTDRQTPSTSTRELGACRSQTSLLAQSHDSSEPLPSRPQTSLLALCCCVHVALHSIS